MPPALSSPPKMTLAITEACQLRCRYCYSDCAAVPKPNELDITVWKRVVQEAIEDGVIQFYIEGGEPLLKPGIFDLLALCATSAMTMLRTHGTLIDDTTADALKDVGLGRVLVDLMGARAETHDRCSGVPGSFASAVEGISRCVARGLPVDILVVLTRQTAPEINALLRFASDLGAERVGILRLYPLGRAKRAWSEMALSLEEQMRTLDGLDPPAGLGVMQSWHPRDKNCCWQAAAIDASGRAIGCTYLREYVDFGRVEEKRYLDIWRENALYRRLRAGQVEQHCPDCSATQGTSGGCRSTAFAFHGRWTAPDPFDQTLNHGLDLRHLPARLLRD